MKKNVVTSLIFLNGMQNRASIFTSPNLCLGIIRFANFHGSGRLFLDVAAKDVKHGSIFTLHGKNGSLTRCFI